MPQSEMEALLQLQKETIESLRQLVESQLSIPGHFPSPVRR